MTSRYPKTVLNALNHVWLCKESLAKSTSNEPDSRVLVNLKQLVDEVIFREIDQWGNHKAGKQMPVQELELLSVFLDYFSGLGGNHQLKRNTVFITLFPPVRSDRLRLLSKLVCMAIFTKNVTVLKAASVWMQELGCTSEFSVKLANDIYLDFFVLVPTPLECLKDLPTLSPHFTANLLATFTERFAMDEGEKFSPPPMELLETITLWISKNPTLCMAAISVNVQLLLPRGTNPRPATSPFGGLIRWCVLTPLHLARIDLTSLEDSELMRKDSSINVEFSKLHLALVQSAAECYSHKQAIYTKGVVSAQQLSTIVGSVCAWVQSLEKVDTGSVGQNIKNRGEKALTCALHRLGQVVHMLLAANCISGNIGDLVSKMKMLPSNRLIQIILDKVNEYTAGSQ